MSQPDQPYDSWSTSFPLNLWWRQFWVNVLHTSCVEVCKYVVLPKYHWKWSTQRPADYYLIQYWFSSTLLLLLLRYSYQNLFLPQCFCWDICTCRSPVLPFLDLFVKGNACFMSTMWPGHRRAWPLHFGYRCVFTDLGVSDSVSRWWIAGAVR